MAIRNFKHPLAELILPTGSFNALTNRALTVPAGQILVPFVVALITAYQRTPQCWRAAQANGSNQLDLLPVRFIGPYVALPVFPE